MQDEGDDYSTGLAATGDRIDRLDPGVEHRQIRPPIFAVAALSFHDARPRGASDVDVKGDFCEQLRVILDDAGRAEDYVAQQAHALRASAPRIKTSTPTRRFSCPAR